MAISSTFPTLNIPQSNVLTYLFGKGASEKPVWIDSKDPSKNLSPRDLLQWVKRLGSGFEQLGLEKGDVVLICTPNHIYVPVAYLSIAGSGYIFSGANPASSVPELVHQLKNTTAKMVFVHPLIMDPMLKAASEVGLSKDRIFLFSDTEEQTRDGIKDWRSISGTTDQIKQWTWPEFGPEESTKTIATLNYSSGTTGLPKGVCISHSSLIANVEQTTFVRYADKPYSFEDRPADRWIGFLPLYHAYGQLFTILMAIRLQAEVYVMSKFVFEDLLDGVQKYKITSLQVAPPILIMLAKRPETSRYNLTSLLDIGCGAAPLSRELQNECQDRFNLVIHQGWGMTELTCGGFQVPGGMKDSTGSVGKLLPNCKAKLVDEDGREVGVGERGEVLVRGPNVCMWYWRNEEATRESFDKDGFFKTGDIAITNEEGFFWIVDRKKELIKVNGLQVSPAELEATLIQHKDIADAAVVGIALKHNEWPRAYVVLQPNAKDQLTPKIIQDWVAERVAKHKKLVGGIVLIDAVPKTESGKIRRKVMKEWAAKDAAAIEARDEKRTSRL